MIAFYSILPQVTIDVTNRNLYFTCGAGGVHTATILMGTYDNMIDVCTAIATAMNTVCAHAYAYSCQLIWDDTYKCCKVKITQDSGTFQLTCTTTTNSIWSLIGYSTASNKTGAASYTGDYQHQRGWYSDKPPSFDSYDRLMIMGSGSHVTENGRLYRITNPTDFNIRHISMSAIPSHKTWAASATSGYTNQDFETCWALIAGNNPLPFNLYSDFAIASNGVFPGSTATNEGIYALTEPTESLSVSIVPRLSVASAYYSFNLVMQKDPT